MTRRPRIKIALVALAVLGVAATAWGYWTTSGSGTASAGVATLNAPTNVSVPSTASSAVHVSWTDSTLSNGTTAASGYYVTRIKNSNSSTSNACGTSQSTLTSSTATSCDDTSVPDGTYHYTVTAVYHSWTAAASSGNVTVVNDTTPPTVTAVVASTTGTQPANFVKANTTYNVYADASDSGSGVDTASVKADVSTITSGQSAVSLTSCSSSCTINGHAYAYKSAGLTADSGLTDGSSKSFTASAKDNAGNTGTANGTATVDNSAPTGSITNPAAGALGGTVLLTSNPADSGSGVSSVTYKYCTPSSCTPATTINSSTTGPSYSVSWDTTSVPNGSYDLQATFVDKLGSTSTTAKVTVTVNNTFQVSATSPQTAGAAFNVTITAKANGSTNTNYTGSQAMSFSGPSNAPNGTAPTYPANVTFTSGVGTASITLFKAQTTTITATSGNLSGTSGAVGVNSAGVALSYNRTCPTTITKNASTTFTILVPNDAYGNSFTSTSGIGVGLTLSNTTNFGFGAVGTGTTTVTITTGPANNTFTIAESGSGKTTTLTATAPSGFTAPPSCTVNST